MMKATTAHRKKPKRMIYHPTTRKHPLANDIENLYHDKRKNELALRTEDEAINIALRVKGQ